MFNMCAVGNVLERVEPHGWAPPSLTRFVYCVVCDKVASCMLMISLLVLTV